MPDLPGFGASEKPNPARYAYGVETHAEALADLIAAFDVGRAPSSGMGWGPPIALTLAAEHPELVQRLILEDASAFRHPVFLLATASLPCVRRLRLQADFTAVRFFDRISRPGLQEGLEIPWTASIGTTMHSIAHPRVRARTPSGAQHSTVVRSLHVLRGLLRRRSWSGVARIACFQWRPQPSRSRDPRRASRDS